MCVSVCVCWRVDVYSVASISQRVFPRAENVKGFLLKIRAMISLHTDTHTHTHTHTHTNIQYLETKVYYYIILLFTKRPFPRPISLFSLSLSRLSQGRVKAYLLRRGLLSGRQTIIVIGRSEDLDLLSEQFKLSWPQKGEKMSGDRKKMCCTKHLTTSKLKKNVNMLIVKNMFCRN